MDWTPIVKREIGPTEAAGGQFPGSIRRVAANPPRSTGAKSPFLLSFPLSDDAWPMGLPTEPVTLNAEQLADLNRKLSTLSHDIRNSLSLIVASAELIKQKPELFEKMMPRISEAPAKISASVDKFRAEFEEAFGITRP